MLRATESAVHRRLEVLLQDGADLAVTEMVVAEMVVAELLAGASEAQRDGLRGRLLAFPVLGLGGLAGFEKAADLYRSARAQGVTIRRLADCLIAVPCLTHGARLLHAGRDFDALARVSALVIEPVGG